MSTLEAELDDNLTRIDPRQERVNCVKLTAAQISHAWEIFLSHSIFKSFEARQRLNELQLSSILQELLNGKLEAWCLVRTSVDGQQTLLLVAILQPLYDYILREKNLLIYAIYALNPAKDHEWAVGADFFRNYLQTQGYKRLVGYSADVRILQIAEAVGANTNVTFISVEV